MYTMLKRWSSRPRRRTRWTMSCPQRGQWGSIEACAPFAYDRPLWLTPSVTESPCAARIGWMRAGEYPGGLTHFPSAARWSSGSFPSLSGRGRPRDRFNRLKLCHGFVRGDAQLLEPPGGRKDTRLDRAHRLVVRLHAPGKRLSHVIQVFHQHRHAIVELLSEQTSQIGRAHV